MTIYIEMRPGDPDAYIRAPFEARNAIKLLPSRWWNKHRKRWIIPAEDVDLAAAQLRSDGWNVFVLDGRHEEPPPPPPPAQKKHELTWADHLYASLPDRFHAPVHAALSKILHPDIGGDTVAMQQLNAARDRAKKAG